MNRLLITNGTIVNEGRRFVGYIEVVDEHIVALGEGSYGRDFSGKIIDASGCLILPGVIDDQVHFREPGLTYKAEIATESAAAVAGGVTSFMEMPNTKPATTTLDLLEQKYDRAAEVSVANYSFYLGAANDNLAEIRRADPKRICGLKLFMGSSTGNMLVDDPTTLAAIFAESPMLLAIHSEDETTIRNNMAHYRELYGDKQTIDMHPLIRSAEACYRSTAHAISLADRYSTQLHVLHLSTARELDLFESKSLKDKQITNEICVHHLWFCAADYARKGNFIKWNPSIKTAEDRAALRQGMVNGKVDMVATDHAPHTLEEKELPYITAPSGGPLVQHSLVAMLELSVQGTFSVESVVEKMCHAPAIRFEVEHRGFLRVGYYADLVIVDPAAPWTVSPENILSKCGWSPFTGDLFSHRVHTTLINGHVVYANGEVDRNFRGKRLTFAR